MNIPLNLPQDLLFGLAPAIIAMITRPTWPAAAKFLLAIGVCFLAAFLEVIITGQAQAVQIGAALGKAFLLTMTAYAALWKAFLPKQLAYLETQINPGPEGPPPPMKSIPAAFPGQDVGPEEKG